MDNIDFALDVHLYFEYVGVRYGQFCFNFEISYGGIKLFKSSSTTPLWPEASDCITRLFRTVEKVD